MLRDTSTLEEEEPGVGAGIGGFLPLKGVPSPLHLSLLLLVEPTG